MFSSHAFSFQPVRSDGKYDENVKSGKSVAYTEKIPWPNRQKSGPVAVRNPRIYSLCSVFTARFQREFFFCINFTISSYFLSLRTGLSWKACRTSFTCNINFCCIGRRQKEYELPGARCTKNDHWKCTVHG